MHHSSIDERQKLTAELRAAMPRHTTIALSGHMQNMRVCRRRGQSGWWRSARVPVGLGAATAAAVERRRPRKGHFKGVEGGSVTGEDCGGGAAAVTVGNGCVSVAAGDGGGLGKSARVDEVVASDCHQ